MTHPIIGVEAGGWTGEAACDYLCKCITYVPSVLPYPVPAPPPLSVTTGTILSTNYLENIYYSMN